MSKFFTLCRANNRKHGLHDRPMELNKSNRRTCNFCYGLSVFLLVLIVVSAGFYLFNITSSATNGFEISDKESKIAELKLQNESLKQRVNSLGDLKNLQEKADGLGLVKISNVEYLDLSQIGVAMR